MVVLDSSIRSYKVQSILIWHKPNPLSVLCSTGSGIHFTEQSRRQSSFPTAIPLSSKRPRYFVHMHTEAFITCCPEYAPSSSALPPLAHTHSSKHALFLQPHHLLRYAGRETDRLGFREHVVKTCGSATLRSMSERLSPRAPVLRRRKQKKVSRMASMLSWP